jgi:methionine-rich copper-binding protein CopC
MKNFLLAPATLAALLCAALCSAHARLDSSTPADKAELRTAPPQIVLHFNAVGQLGSFKLLKGDKEIPLALDFAPKDTDTFTFRLPPLPAGAYTVQWSMLSADDGHVTKGAFTFTVKG